jgi:hypothetical protein
MGNGAGNRVSLVVSAGVCSPFVSSVSLRVLGLVGLLPLVLLVLVISGGGPPI